jgi:hypothetical protein
MRFPCLSVAYQLTTTHPPVAGAAEALCPVGNAGASAAVLDVAAAVLDEAAVVPSELAKVWGNLAPGSKVAEGIAGSLLLAFPSNAGTVGSTGWAEAEVPEGLALVEEASVEF